MSIAVIAIGCNPGPTDNSEIAGSDLAAYRAIEFSRLPAAETAWNGRRWRVNAGTVLDNRLNYSVRVDPAGERIRFELRDSQMDRSPRDSLSTRRAELSGSLYGDKQRLPNGVPLWGAYKFRHHPWPDPVGMKRLSGGVYGQIHMGSGFGGSPALAFRRTRDGLFRITTRGQYDPEGTVRYEGPLSFDAQHELIYRVVLDPLEGGLAVWLDGERVVQLDGISVGHDNAEAYWNLGVYFSGGVAGRVIAEYWDHTYPGPHSLWHRVGKSPPN